MTTESAGGPDETFRRVADLVAQGEVVRARELADQVAAEYAERAPAEAAKALRLGAGLSRLLGRPREGLDRAERAIRLADGVAGVVAAARLEVAEARLALGEAAAAARAFDALAREPGRTVEERLSLRRRQADALASEGQVDAATEVLRTAAADAVAGGAASEAAGALVQGVALAQGEGRSDLVDVLRSAAGRTAADAGSPGALAELDLLTAARSLARGDLAAARSAARSARGHALEAIQPLAYLAAVLAGSRIADRVGDRVDAYRLLATGYATLADLLGAELSRQTFEPELLALRDRWGAEAFASVKAAHDAARRRARSADRRRD
ncbi:hypothetical protein [Actinopolymorpha pittospori]|uniref:Uncharacterized protein n=1 Tax=Actinopolymorpha pittospori TaxID=648752 RepID=A0A927N2Y3_9ACTN|nr:hypothetical protein [Actinopolymorpha pittospori]MBE1611676.1 hypothetical protein [Actinopolymorpha pittospori]